MTATLSTKSLALRPLTKATPQHVEWLNDPETVKFSEQRHVTHTPASVARYVNSFDHKSGFLWSVVHVESGKPIGTVASRIDEDNSIADLGILLGDMRGKGYGREAWNACAGWLLAKNGAAVRKVEAGTMAVNTPMRRTMDATGFRLEGERLNHFLWQSQPVGMVLYGRFP